MMISLYEVSHHGSDGLSSLITKDHPSPFKHVFHACMVELLPLPSHRTAPTMPLCSQNADSSQKLFFSRSTI